MIDNGGTMDDELKQLCEPDAGLCGWDRDLIDSVTALRDRAEDGKIGFNTWSAADAALREGAPRADKAEVKRLRAVVQDALDNGHYDDVDEIFALSDLSRRAGDVVRAVPTREKIEKALKRLREPLDESVTGSPRELALEAQTEQIRTRRRWLRELESGVDEDGLINGEDRALLVGAGDSIVVRAVALLHEGVRPLANASQQMVDELVAEANTCPRSVGQDVDDSFALAEWWSRIESAEGRPLDVDDLYARLSRLGRATDKMWQLRRAAWELAATEVNAWRRRLDEDLAGVAGRGRQRPSRAGLIDYGGWMKSEARTIFGIADRGCDKKGSGR